MSQSPVSPPKPSPEVIELYRAAAAAYRAVRQRGELDYPARIAARDAAKKIRPELSDEDAMDLAGTATVYPAAHGFPSYPPAAPLTPAGRPFCAAGFMQSPAS
jgi:hypothetical protein